MRVKELPGGLLALLAAFALAGPAAAAATCPGRSAGYYTKAQADQGKATFDSICAACHQSDLAGQAGPALAGKAFVEWLEFTKITGADLFSFISTQMPYDAPGSLSSKQYEDVFAYILSYNRYPAGPTPLSPQSVACIAMLPYPK